MEVRVDAVLLRDLYPAKTEVRGQRPVRSLSPRDLAKRFPAQVGAEGLPAVPMY